MSEQDYLERRIAEEYAAASTSVDERAATTHRELACAYECRLVKLLHRRRAA